ncbi:hypothetical protein H696_05541 [Fonticula alba]|uniref:Protein kinase domain-containing protein n=1 Tax=Fonticula alba TaxID=691883 RepID=A0A058Z1C3_FONAL|nr:hypothetical protein H696_05541 [Fonticula alba]KCV68064.1 hypothetical protein H696_05541 [Fonticula alba]|eukprot:XP_009497631.1 hypothetical protein H696_05541 [Fonticula alba]
MLADVPAGVEGSGARLLAAPAAAILPGLRPVHALLPPSAAEVGTPQRARLNGGPGGGGFGTWTWVSGRRALLDRKTFGCPMTGTIRERPSSQGVELPSGVPARPGALPMRARTSIGVSCLYAVQGPGLGRARGDSLRVGLLLVLLILKALLAVRRRKRQAMEREYLSTTVLSTIIKLALPGAILVDVAGDFRPLDEQLGAGTEASVDVAQSAGPGIAARLGCPEVVAIKKLRADKYPAGVPRPLPEHGGPDITTFVGLNAMSVPCAAPEVLPSGVPPWTGGHLFPAEVYSASVILFKCLTRMVPWPGKSIAEIMAAVFDGSRPVANPLAGDVTNLAQAGWQKGPGRRPPAGEWRYFR